MISKYVRSRLKSGAYDSFTSATRFAEAVTADMRHVNGDLHLSMRWDPTGPFPATDPSSCADLGRARPEGAGGAQVVRRVEVAPGGDAGPSPGGSPQAIRRLVSGAGGPGAGPDAGGGADSGPPPQWMRDAYQHN
jgi:hypothetical protein